MLENDGLLKFSMTGFVIKREGMLMHIERRWLCEDRGRDWRYAAMNKGYLGESRKHHSLKRLKGAWPCQHLDF